MARIVVRKMIVCPIGCNHAGTIKTSFEKTGVGLHFPVLSDFPEDRFCAI